MIINQRLFENMKRKDYKFYICLSDIDECLSSPCVHGNCTNLINMFSCVCQPGFTGVKCDTGGYIFKVLQPNKF